MRTWLRLPFIVLSIAGLIGYGATSMAANMGKQADESSIPTVTSGKIDRIALFQSQFVNARNIDVWLPPHYDQHQRYNVLYMHDGQMLYDAAITWNKKAWHVDRTVDQLLSSGALPNTIIVGIWNIAPLRHSEYFPEKALTYLDEPLRKQLIEKALDGQPRADRYLRFLVEELKPYIDKTYSTMPDRDHTFIMGSSMGGLISIYAMSEYPSVFGGAACLSTHWPGTFTANAAIPLAFFNYLQHHLPDPAHHRIYMDHGTETLDALYQVPQSFVDLIVRDKGYDDEHFITQVFPGTKHDEDDWSKRLALPLQFLIRAGSNK